MNTFNFRTNRNAVRYIISGLIILIPILYVASTILYYSNTEYVTITVTDKESITVSNGKSSSHKYLIFTENEVFENTDALLLGKYNSSDVQNKLKIGHRYKVYVVGYRVPFISMYRNIIRIYSPDFNENTN